jgi:hypothetical protein
LNTNDDVDVHESLTLHHSRGHMILSDMKHDSFTPKNIITPRNADVTIATDDGVFKGKIISNQQKTMTPVPLNFGGGESPMYSPIESSNGKVPAVVQIDQRLNFSVAQRLGRMSLSAKECLSDGVRKTTLMIDSENAIRIRFDEEGFPASIFSRSEMSTAAFVSEIRKSMLHRGRSA